MKQLIITQPEMAHIREVETPIPEKDQVCIRVEASGICGTDMHIYHGGFVPSYPVVPGHEFAGEVVALGPECQRIELGMRVAVEPNLPCNNCENCLCGRHHYCQNMEINGVNVPGGMGEYCLVRERGVFATGELGATAAAFMEPVSCVIHAQERLRGLTGENILILGAGPIGLLHGLLAAQQGARRIDFVEIAEGRRQKARQYGDCFTDIEQVERQYDIIIDATGVSQLLGNATKNLRSQGKLLVFGVPKENSTLHLNHYEIFRREIEIIGSFTSLKNSFQAIECIRRNEGEITNLVSHKISLEDLPGIFSGEQKLINSVKIMVTG